MMRRCDRTSVAGSSFSVFRVVVFISVYVILVPAQTGPGRTPVYPQNQTVLNGTSVTFQCIIPGAESVVWRDEDNTPLLHDGRVSVSESGLSINPVKYQTDQRGIYCVGVFGGVVNETTKSPTVYLNVLYVEYNFLQDLPSSMTVYVGDPVVFTCLPPEANPPINEWTWMRNRVRLQSVSGKIIVNDTQLELHNTTIADSAFYSCIVGNGNFSRTSTKSHLLVKPRPVVNDMATIHSVVPHPKQVFAVPGSNHTLRCNVSLDVTRREILNNTRVTIVWRILGMEIRNTTKRRVLNDGIIKLYNFDESLVGDYRCTATLEFMNQQPMEEHAVVMVELATIGEDVTLSPSAVTSGRGNRAEFTCSLPRSNPQPTVKWIKNGSTIVNSSRFEILLYQDTSRMVISPLELEDAGEYICEVENEAGNRSAMAALTVQDFPNVTINGGNVYVREGSNLSLSCQSSSDSASTYQWYFGRKLITTSDSAKYSVPNPSRDVLNIVNISESEIGDYVCEVIEDSIHVPRKATGFVRFTDKLYIKSEPKNQTVLVEMSVTLECEFRAHYADPVTNRLDLQWFHHNPEVLNDTRHTIYTPSPPGRSVLVIKNVSRTDDGSYTCKAQLNGTEDINRVIVLNVITRAYFKERPPPSVTVKKGENVSIECVGGGNPPPKTVWRKVGRDLTVINGTLLLSNVQESDEGIYECAVIGQRDSVKAETNVIVTTFVGLDVSAETIIVVVVGLVALVLYLLIVVIILCACAQCCKARLQNKHKEVLQMEAEVRRASRKAQDVKDNSAILQQTPGFSSPSAFATTSFAIPPTPSPTNSRRGTTVVSVDAPMAYSIPSPPPSLPTTITEPVELSNFSRRNLKLGDRLGEGEFGPIFLGTAYGLSTDGSPMLVAVKVWMHSRDEDEEGVDYDLMNFYSQMRLRFDNIASIVGMCTDVEPYYIIYEYLERGDLKQFLQDSRPDEIGIPTLTQENLLHIIKQVANGMAYLASQRIIHGDLAARSCIVSSDLRVKVADLGIGHDVYREDYYDNGEQLLPVRWMPPEILHTAEFTLHSDMWSFGVFCWEVFAFGRLPYEDITDEEVLRLVPQGLRLEVPEEGCPIPLYSIMRECWNPHPEARPKFSRLVVAIIDLNLD